MRAYTFIAIVIAACSTDPQKTTTAAAQSEAANKATPDTVTDGARNSGPAARSLEAKGEGTADAVERRPAPNPVALEDIVAVTLLSPRSLSTKLRLKGGRRLVFKPMLKSDRRARLEVAAFRMAELLGLSGVPAAVMGELPLVFLTNRLEKDDAAAARALRENALVSAKEKVVGAEITWVTDIEPEGLKQLGGIPALKSWLKPARPATSLEPVLSKQASEMVCFDYIIGNWDRFSGGNLFVNRRADRLVLLDHNGTFSSWSGAREERMERLIEETERFSRPFLEKARRLTAADIEAVFPKEAIPDVSPLLTAGEISLVLARRDRLVRHVDRLVAEKGEGNVIVFD